MYIYNTSTTTTAAAADNTCRQRQQHNHPVRIVTRFVPLRGAGHFIVGGEADDTFNHKAPSHHQFNSSEVA